MKFYEHYKRSLVKTVTYRILIIISTLFVVYAVTQKTWPTLEITGIASISSTLIYFLHERVWSAVRWWKQNHVKEGRSR